MLEKGRMVMTNIVAVGTRNSALRSKMRKLEKWENILVGRTEHTSVPVHCRSAKIKLAWASLLRYWD